MTSEATAERSATVPKVRIGRLLGFVLPALTAMYCLFNGIQQILLPAQVAAFDPAHKVVNLAVLTLCASVASMLGVPAGGAVSDRTRSRFGRRTPWIVGMSAVAGVLAIAVGLSPNVLVLGITITLLWFSANFYQGAISAVLPDRVPENRRGVASSVMALGTPLGILIGVNVASHVGQVAGYSIIAVLLVATSVVFVLGSREGSSLDRPRNAPTAGLGRRAAVRSFFDAFSSRDFTLAFISRFALFFAYFTVSGYLFYTLTDYIGTDELPGHNAATAVATLSSLTVIVWIVMATFCGWLADKLNRRKLFVSISALGLVVTMFIPIISPTWGGMVLYSGLIGLFIGTYFAVDLAVMSLVLPNKDQEGRDFGILAVATGLPTILSSVVAGGLITLFHGYTALYVFGAVCALIAGTVVLAIKKVR
jgi:MFS family permease